jgi:hypothetical protein
MGIKLLKIFMTLLAFIPIVTGVLGLFGLSNPEYSSVNITGQADIILDTNLRFLSGVWLIVGVSFLRIIPSIERESTMFRTLWGMIFLGGIGRILSISFFGLPPTPFIFVTLLEILGAPLFIFWQGQYSKSSHLFERTSDPRIRVVQEK